MKSEAQIREALEVMERSSIRPGKDEHLALMRIAIIGWLHWMLDDKDVVADGAQRLLDGLRRDQEIAREYMRKMEVN